METFSRDLPVEAFVAGEDLEAGARIAFGRDGKLYRVSLGTFPAWINVCPTRAGAVPLIAYAAEPAVPAPPDPPDTWRDRSPLL